MTPKQPKRGLISGSKPVRTPCTYAVVYIFHLRETKANNIDETRKSFFFYGSYINIFMGSKGMLTIVTKKHHDACFSFSDFLLFCSKAKK